MSSHTIDKLIHNSAIGFVFLCVIASITYFPQHFFIKNGAFEYTLVEAFKSKNVFKSILLAIRHLLASYDFAFQILAPT